MNLCVLCVSVVFRRAIDNHRATEDTEVAQRKPNWGTTHGLQD
jgi:hypothetical protein